MAFEGKGPLNDEEIRTLLDVYHKHGKNEYQTEIHFGSNVDPKIERLANQLTQNMGGLMDRLALTIVDLYHKNAQEVKSGNY